MTKPPPAAYTTPSRPSFADVVRAGKQMAAQGSGHGGDHGARGGGRGRGTTPGFTRVSTQDTDGAVVATSFPRVVEAGVRDKVASAT